VIPWNRDVILWNHGVILVFAARFPDFSAPLRSLYSGAWRKVPALWAFLFSESLRLARVCLTGASARGLLAAGRILIGENADN
jgi:hypothetical protein